MSRDGWCRAHARTAAGAPGCAEMPGHHHTHLQPHIGTPPPGPAGRRPAKVALSGRGSYQGGTPPGPLHQFAFFSTTSQRISKISVSMKSSVHVLSKYEGITMFEFLKFDTWANNRHIGCTFVVQRWVHRDPWVADLDS